MVVWANHYFDLLHRFMLLHWRKSPLLNMITVNWATIILYQKWHEAFSIYWLIEKPKN